MLYKTMWNQPFAYVNLTVLFPKSFSRNVAWIVNNTRILFIVLVFLQILFLGLLLHLIFILASVSHMGNWKPKQSESLLGFFVTSGSVLPGVLVHSCDFDSGLCGWLKDKDDDLHWEPVRDLSGEWSVYSHILQLKNLPGLRLMTVPAWGQITQLLFP